MPPRVIGRPGNTNEICDQRRIGDINKVIARRTLNLSAGELDVALQVLFAVRAGKFEFFCHYDFSELELRPSSSVYKKGALAVEKVVGFRQIFGCGQINKRRTIDRRRPQDREQCSLWNSVSYQRLQ